MYYQIPLVLLVGWLLSLDAFAGEENDCSEPVCFKIATEHLWPSTAIGPKTVSLGGYDFKLTNDFIDLVVREDMLVFKNQIQQKLVLSLRHRDELIPGISDTENLADWARVVFEKTPKQLVDKDRRKAFLFKKALLSESDQLLRYSKGDFVAYLFSGKMQQPFPVVVMVFDSLANDHFLMFESDSYDKQMMEQILAGMRKGQR